MIDCAGGDPDYRPLKGGTAGTFGLTGVKDQQHVCLRVLDKIVEAQFGCLEAKCLTQLHHIHAGGTVAAELYSYSQ